MWNDDKFCELSPPKPNAQTLWVWLITGPLTTMVPGLVPVGLGTMSDRLGWPYSSTQEKWREIEALGMAKADWKAPLVWLPRAVHHNPPEAPNVAIGWRRTIQNEIPPCPLRDEAER